MELLLDVDDEEDGRDVFPRRPMLVLPLPENLPPNLPPGRDAAVVGGVGVVIVVDCGGR